MPWYEVVGAVFYYLSFPLVKLVFLLGAFVRLLLSPFIYVGNVTLQLFIIPLNIAAKFEPVWYFLAYALFTGAVTALILHGIFRLFVLVFQLNKKPVSRAFDIPAKGHDIKSYREARERKKRLEEKERREIEATAQALATSPLLKEAMKQMRRDSPGEDAGGPGTRIRRRASLYNQTILEQTDEDDS